MILFTRNDQNCLSGLFNEVWSFHHPMIWSTGISWGRIWAFYSNEPHDTLQGTNISPWFWACFESMDFPNFPYVWICFLVSVGGHLRWKTLGCSCCIFPSNIWVVVSNIFCFHPYLGKIPILANIFQWGWFNHQPDIVWKKHEGFPSKPLTSTMIYLAACGRAFVIVCRAIAVVRSRS